MRKVMLLLAGLACAGCATTDRMPIRHAQADNMGCRVTGLEQFHGRPASPELAFDIIRASGARDIRWVQPGQAVTLEHRADRVTVRLDSQNRVQSIACT